MPARSVTLSALTAILLSLLPVTARAAGVAKVALKQSGATLVPGQSVVFEAVALDKQGNVVPGAQIRFKSSKSAIVKVLPDGTATAANVLGEAVITASSGKKKATADIDVVAPGTGSDSANITVLKGSINHVVADDGWVYWTETGSKQTRLRKIAKTGGLIYDLAAEPAKDERQLTVSYIHLRLVGDRVLFSRQTLGFFSHFSIVSVAADGSDPQTLLKEDISIEPLSAGAWNVVGRKLLVAVLDPVKLRLPDNTRLAILDLDSGEWSVGVRGDFVSETLYITAVDGQFAYLRGTIENHQTQVARLDPAVGPESRTAIFTFNDEDTDTPQSGAVDSANLYFFAQGQGETHRLLSLPLAGPDPVSLDSGPLGLGLTLKDGFLNYAIEGERLARIPATGGKREVLRIDLDPTSTTGGIGIDDDSLYPVTKQGKVSTIHRTAR